MTNIINFYGGPGAGKSTSAAYFYYLLKTAGANVELVREYVKDWAWDNRKISTYDQIYFLGKQVRRESMLYDKVDWIVTDSPIMMNLYYAHKYCTPNLAEGVRSSVLAFYRQAMDDGHQHHHIMLHRNFSYAAEGRYQTEAEARAMDQEIKFILQGLKISLKESTSDESELHKIYETIYKK